jgi:16S rRNA (cytidine1402-2'-O)-methyltransferase
MTQIPRSHQRRESKGTLYVVATPIGNLDDISVRALKTLKAVQLVAAEDTRRTGNLLRHFDIHTPILSVHEHNERGRAHKVVVHLAQGDSVAVVTDAGTPGISDPGAALVAIVREAGYRVEPIPGANAAVAAVSAAGIDSNGFTFLGFPPIRGKDRKLWLEELRDARSKRAVVFYEAPHKLQKTLGDLTNLVEQPIMAARELTKLHEEIVWGLPGELVERFPSPQGEFTIVVPPQNMAQNTHQSVADSEVMALFGQIAETTPLGSRRALARVVGERLGMRASDVYAVLERNKLG